METQELPVSCAGGWSCRYRVLAGACQLKRSSFRQLYRALTACVGITLINTVGQSSCALYLLDVGA